MAQVIANAGFRAGSLCSLFKDEAKGGVKL